MIFLYNKRNALLTPTGLDMAGVYNGYVYHTKYDRFAVISRNSLQNTGDNLLSLVRSIANAEEMYDTEVGNLPQLIYNTCLDKITVSISFYNLQQAHAEGHSVFFDFLGLFFVYYVESTGIALNISFAIGGLVMVCVSLWRMSRTTVLSVGDVAVAFGILFLLEIAAFLLALGLPILMAVMYDAGGRSLTYLSSSWLVVGLYICPSLIGLALPVTLYFTLLPRVR